MKKYNVKEVFTNFNEIRKAERSAKYDVCARKETNESNPAKLK